MTVGELRRARKKCDERIDAIKSEHRDGRPKEEIKNEIDSLKSRIGELKEEKRRITRVLDHQNESTKGVTL
jgi:chromosome segregation ATPase